MANRYIASEGSLSIPHVDVDTCSDSGRQRERGVGRVAPPAPAAVPGHAARAAAASAPRAAPPAAALPAGETAAAAVSALAHECPFVRPLR